MGRDNFSVLIDEQFRCRSSRQPPGAASHTPITTARTPLRVRAQMDDGRHRINGSPLRLVGLAIQKS